MATTAAPTTDRPEATREQEDVIDAMACRCDSVGITINAAGTVTARAMVGVRTVFVARIAADGSTSEVSR